MLQRLNVIFSQDKENNLRIFLINDNYWWNDEIVMQDLQKLGITYDGNNAILKLGKKVIYGWEDDGQIGFTLSMKDLLFFATNRMSAKKSH